MRELNYVLGVLGSTMPVRSGNMLRNTFISGNKILIDTHYVPYTNEEWISPQWRGRENPNYKWVETSLNIATRNIARGLGGVVRVK